MQKEVETLTIQWNQFTQNIYSFLESTDLFKEYYVWRKETVNEIIQYHELDTIIKEYESNPVKVFAMIPTTNSNPL